VTFDVDLPEEFITEDTIYGMTIPKIEPRPEDTARFGDMPNLLIISIDTLRSDYVGAYRDLEGQSNEFSFSPNLDRFAEQSVVFRRAYTPLSATWPGLASMHTSLYPSENGVLYNGYQFPFYYDTIGTHMMNLGYETLSLHGNCYGLHIPGIEEKYMFFHDDMALIKNSLGRLSKAGDSPFFHWFHFIGVHANYKPPKWTMEILAKDETYRFYDPEAIMRGEDKVSPDDLDYIRLLYAGELLNLDFELNKIFSYLKRNQLWDRTMIVVTSDHGEDLYQHNNHFFHYPSLYNTALRIPLMIKFPYQEEQMLVEESVSLIDIFPTIVDYFRAPDHEGKIYEFSGMSLLPLLQGEKKAFQKRSLFAGAEHFEITAALRDDWKLIYNPKKISILTRAEWPYPYKELELYNTAEDFLEENNIFGDNLDLVRELIKEIESFAREHRGLKKSEKGFRTKTNKEFDKRTLERLKALGYIK
jgi:arylsulfatase A-like enzyme